MSASNDLGIHADGKNELLPLLHNLGLVSSVDAPLPLSSVSSVVPLRNFRT
jgi:hypothetical protein